MCEIFKMEESEKGTRRFPLRTAPVEDEKFPFRDVRHYNSSVDAGEVNSKPKVPKLGYLAQRSVRYLEATGRKPELQNVPWFTIPESNAGRR